MMLGGIACLRRRWWAQRSGAVKPRPRPRGPRRSDHNRARSGAISGHPQQHGRHGRGQDGDRRGEHRHRKGTPPQQPLTTGLRDRRPRQGRGHCWSHLDAHQDDAPSQALVRRHVRAPVERASGFKSCSWGCGCQKTRSQTRVERSAILPATGERRVKAAGGAHRQPRFSIALARFNDRRAWARKELRTAPREPIDRKPDPFAHGGIASSQPIAHAGKRA